MVRVMDRLTTLLDSAKSGGSGWGHFEANRTGSGVMQCYRGLTQARRPLER